MRKELVIAAIALTSTFYSQKNTWQQEVNYAITANLDDQKGVVLGEENIEYTNNSKDSLSEIYLHLYWNAFKKGSHAFNVLVKDQTEMTKSDFGSIEIESIKINGEIYSLEVFESIGKIKLKKPIAPAEKTQLIIKFSSNIPACINRAGKDNSAGTDFTLTQWYPKICRYDSQGWHTDPYFGREFAGTFGKYNVSISCNKRFVIAGTGLLSNKSYTTNGWADKQNVTQQGEITEWKFVAENVHDFAWAAETEWIHNSIRIDQIDFHFFYHQDYKMEWENLMANWKKAYTICKEEFGEYPYPQFSFIQAGEGYMEYPNCTMLQGSRMDFFNTACHEFMHNYFYGIYGSDENLHHWMDEGVTCYAEARISQFEGENKNYLSEAMSSYNWVRMMYPEEPISTAANHFDHDYAYYNAAYYKGQLFPELIRYMIGDKNMKKGFHRYYANWKFKHPEPNDFVKTFEDVSQMELTWFQNYWLNTTKIIDFGIDSVRKSKNALSFTITREGVPLPVEFSVELKDGSINYYYIPLDLNNNLKNDFYRTTQSLAKWSCGEPNYSISLPGISIKDVLKITLDPDGFLPDVFMENNSWPIEKE
jgi:hypothetical protein